MKLTKHQRELLKQKYNGRCAYCGDLLPDRWCADHIEPLVRDYWLKGNSCQYPERDTIDNLNPSCSSCNTIKGSGSLERFRAVIGGFIQSLNRDSTQYKFARRYGLVQEVEQPVTFYYEQFNGDNS